MCSFRASTLGMSDDSLTAEIFTKIVPVVSQRILCPIIGYFNGDTSIKSYSTEIKKTIFKKVIHFFT